jgi:hypothetical protein
MTEAEWLACEDPHAMLTTLKGRGCERKLQLLACACCRLNRRFVSTDGFTDVIALCEQVADGSLTRAELYANAEHLLRRPGLIVRQEDYPLGFDPVRALRGALAADSFFGASVSLPSHYWDEPDREAGRRECCHLVRCVFGTPPFLPRGPFGRLLAAARGLTGLFAGRSNPSTPLAASGSATPIPLNAEWRTDTAVTLARQMYESRDFSAMPILADALQDAGCDNEDVLSHCRGPGPHVRGCWVVDLVLGKE